MKEQVEKDAKGKAESEEALEKAMENNDYPDKYISMIRKSLVSLFLIFHYILFSVAAVILTSCWLLSLMR